MEIKNFIQLDYKSENKEMTLLLKAVHKRLI